VFNFSLGQSDPGGNTFGKQKNYSGSSKNTGSIGMHVAANAIHVHFQLTTTVLV